MTAEVAGAYISLRAVQQQQAIATALMAAQRQRSEAAGALVRSGLATAGADADLAAARAGAQAEHADLEAGPRGCASRSPPCSAPPRPMPPWPAAASSHNPRRPRTPAGQPTCSAPARTCGRRNTKCCKPRRRWASPNRRFIPACVSWAPSASAPPSPSSPFGVAGGPAIEVPLLDYGRRQATVSARQALYDEAVAAYAQSVLTAYGEAVTAQANWRARRAATAQYASALEAAERRAREARVLQREGLADLSRLADAEAGMLEARRRLVLAREAEALSLAALYKALGGAAAPATQVAGSR